MSWHFVSMSKNSFWMAPLLWVLEQMEVDEIHLHKEKATIDDFRQAHIAYYQDAVWEVLNFDKVRGDWMEYITPTPVRVGIPNTEKNSAKNKCWALTGAMKEEFINDDQLRNNYIYILHCFAHRIENCAQVEVYIDYRLPQLISSAEHFQSLQKKELQCDDARLEVYWACTRLLKALRDKGIYC